MLYHVPSFVFHLVAPFTLLHSYTLSIILFHYSRCFVIYVDLCLGCNDCIDIKCDIVFVIPLVTNNNFVNKMCQNLNICTSGKALKLDYSAIAKTTGLQM